MPRAGWTKPATDQRLSDHVALGVLTRTFPAETVDEVVLAAGRVEQRNRLLPARLVVYYVLAMALFSSSSYEEVMRELVDGLAWAEGWRTSWRIPTKAAIFRARSRLGHEPLRALFERVAQPVATPQTAGAFFRGWRVVAIDGSTLDIADTPDNAAEFDRPGTGRGEGSAFPQVRIVALAEAGTHAITAVAMDACTVGEPTLAKELVPRLQAGMLCLADRGYTAFPLWQQAAATGADLLWRAKTNAVLPSNQALADGSYLSELVESSDPRRERGLPVRVIEYAIADPGRPQAEATRYRLITTVLDPAAAPAAELAALYSERWEFETALDELKTHQRGPRLVLRSKTPDGVRQEVYGYLCTHYAIRVLMHEAAQTTPVDPDRLSFIRSLRAVRRSIRAQPGFFPSAPA